jgi:hypothetical protein
MERSGGLMTNRLLLSASKQMDRCTVVQWRWSLNPAGEEAHVATVTIAACGLSSESFLLKTKKIGFPFIRSCYYLGQIGLGE